MKTSTDERCAEHEATHRHLDHGFGDVDSRFVVPDQSPSTDHPPERALDGQLLVGADLKVAFDPSGLLDDLKTALAERAAELDHHLATTKATKSPFENAYG